MSKQLTILGNYLLIWAIVCSLNYNEQLFVVFDIYKIALSLIVQIGNFMILQLIKNNKLPLLIIDY